MIIRKRRIRSLEHNLPGLRDGTTVVCGVRDLDRFGDQLQEVGFPADPQPGEAVLPAPIFGKVSRMNAEGGVIRHRDRPMETAYRTVEWSWTEWHGRDREEKTDFRDVSYKRYPRTPVPPPAIEVRLVQPTGGGMMVVASATTLDTANPAALRHVINLFLEIFGECEIFTEDLEPLLSRDVRRLNWEVLPQGRHPWERVRAATEPFVQREPGGNHAIIRHRLQKISGYEPTFVAVGRAGFSGYVVFGFPARDLYVLESTRANNATYVFGDDWETLSQMTKAEILSEDRQKGRIIHRAKSWEGEIDELLR